MRSSEVVLHSWDLKAKGGDFPGGTEVKNPPANTGDTSSIPGP